MRTDIFIDKKCIHVKLDKDTHSALRAKLFRHSVSMQDLFEECARMVASETSRGQAIVESIVNRKIKEAMTGVKKKRSVTVSEMDADTLYSLINEATEAEK
jgi:hypothetical protein